MAGSKLAMAVAGCLSALPALAGNGYGIFDARTLAMGGASVAGAINDNAQFYNAALLAFNDEREEDNRDSRFLFPIVLPQASKSVTAIEEISGNDRPGAISRSVDAYNAAPGADTADAVLRAVTGLAGSLDDIVGEDLAADVFVGLGISEPGRFQGAGFFAGTRVLAGGTATVSDEDLALVEAYREGMRYVASGGTEGVAHPELFDAGGALLDPVDDFDSGFGGAGAVVIEAGVAMSRQFRVFGSDLAAGLSFKVQSIETFEDSDRLVDDRLDLGNHSDRFRRLNFDLGLARDFGERWRVGLAVKDVIPYNLDTSLDNPIRFRPRARLGAAYRVGPLQFAADIDLNENEPLADEAPTRELAFGAEWRVRPQWRLRAGYRTDLAGDREPVLSVGGGLLWKRLAVDIALAAGDDAEAAALQFGVAF